MADEGYLTYEQVLKELETNRGQLNQFIRSGRLKQHVVEGETCFRQSEVTELKGELEKEPTVMEEWAEVEVERDTAMLDEAAPTPPEPGTRVIEDADAGERRTTDVIGEGAPAGEPDTVVLEEEAGKPQAERPTEALEGVAEELGLEDTGEGSSPSDSALETELDLKAVSAEPQPAAEAEAPAAKEEDFFDFSGDLEDVEFELEAPPQPEEAEGESGADEIEEGPEVVTEILDLGDEDDLAEEDLLSDIMEIEEEAPVGEGADDSADITAEITTLEEPSYEESDLDELLEAEEEVGAFEEELGVADEFEVPYAAPAEGARAVGFAYVAMLVAALVVLVIAGLFLVENSVNPRYSTGLTGWSPFGPKAK